MTNKLFLILFFLCCTCFLQAENNPIKIEYDLRKDPIDVVIVSHPKDKETLEYCIEGIRDNCSKVRRIIIVSSEKLSDNCEWFDREELPFQLK